MKNKVDIVNNQTGALADEVFESLHDVVHRLRAQRFRQLRDSGLELAHMEAKALGFFARRPLATQGDLVAHSGRDKAQVARLIATLRDKDLLEAHANAEDRRSVRLQLTSSGQKLWQVMQAESRRLQSAAVADLSEDECRQLIALLGKLGARLGERPADERPPAAQRKPRRER